MKGQKRRGIGGFTAALLAAVAVAFIAVALLSSPAKAQTAPSTTGYPIPPSTGTAPQIVTTTTKAALAFTGADIAGMMVAAAVVIGAGGTLVLVARRRRVQQ